MIRMVLFTPIDILTMCLVEEEDDLFRFSFLFCFFSLKFQVMNSDSLTWWLKGCFIDGRLLRGCFIDGRL